MYRLMMLLCLLLATVAASATTWGPASQPDPILPEETCNVSEPNSYGSYIYQWPEKYDQVFWPLTDANGVWFCEKSGFTALIGDFDGLSDDEKARIAAYLKANYQPTAKPTTAQRLDLLEHVYALRDKDAAFRIKLLRVIAYCREAQLKDLDGARSYRERALAEIRRALTGTLEDGQRYEYLFVAAAYERELGDAKRSDELLDQLRAALGSNKEAKLANFVEYLGELAKDVPRIEPGGVLAPPVATNHHDAEAPEGEEQL